ncbi:Metal dependent phosphohydrolase, related, related, partial [Eimeria necatrix]
MVEEMLESILEKGKCQEIELEDLNLIQQLIEGAPKGYRGLLGGPPVDELTRAAFDIVANQRTGLDVDRLDYL